MNIINFQLMQNVIINQTVVMCDIKKIATEQFIIMFECVHSDPI